MEKMITSDSPYYYRLGIVEAALRGAADFINEGDGGEIVRGDGPQVRAHGAVAEKIAIRYLPKDELTLFGDLEAALRHLDEILVDHV